MAVISQNLTGNSMLRIGGAVVAVFSLVMGVLILYVIPGACSFVGSIQLLILGFLFIAGALAFLIGQVLKWKSRN